MKLWSIVLLVALVMSSVAAVSAQNGDVDYVVTAYENTIALETFVYESDSVINQALNMGGADMEQELSQLVTVTGIRNDEGFDFSAVSESQMGMMGMALDLTFELIRVDGVLYGRGAGEGDGMMANVAGTMFPEGWVNISEDGAAYPGFSAYTSGSGTLMFDQFANPFGLFPLTPTAVKGLVELDPEEVDGRPVRVFQFDVDFENMDPAVMGAITEVVGGAVAGAGTGTAGIDVETMMQDMMESIEATITVYIDDAEQIILQAVVDQTLGFGMTVPGMADKVQIDQATTTTVRLLDYNIPVEIVAPELGS